MRVALLTEIPAPFRIPLFNELARRVELDVAFLGLTQPGRPYRLHEGELAFRWRVLPGLRLVLRGRWIALNRGVVATVRRADVVVVGGWNQPAFWLAAATARVLGRPLVVWSESTARDARREDGVTARVRLRLVAAAAAVIVPGGASADYARMLGARRVVVAPNAVDARLFRDEVDALRTAPGERCGVLAVARLSEEKGIDVLLRAAAEVPEVDVLVVGDGPEQERLRALAPPTVTFHGAADRDELPRLYAAADAVVVPSRSETWGMAISEAALAGLPIVASDAAGAAHDLVEDGVNGFVVPAGDATALAGALRRVAADPQWRLRAGRRSRELGARLTPEAWADAVAALALDLHGGAHGRK